jgi:hypothetical protein
VQVELRNLADPAVGHLLTGRGYRLASYENVLARPITGDAEPVRPPGVEVRPSGDEELDIWLGVVLDAVAHPDTGGLPWPDASRAGSSRTPNTTSRPPVRAATSRWSTASPPVARACTSRTASPVQRRDRARRGFDLLYTRAVLVR